MSIQEHKWSDEDVHLDITNRDAIDFYVVDDADNSLQFYFNEQDAIAIAKHFNQDRESLVLKIKGLIIKAGYTSAAMSPVFALEQFYDGVLELTKDNKQ